MTLANVTSAVNGELYYMNESLSERTAAGVVIDSRQVREDYIFIAAKGARTDGHRFIADVFSKGALAVICEKLPEEPYGPCILVSDSYGALRKLAVFYRQQVEIRVVGITGSVGKTSTKEFIASVLSEHFRVHKTSGNFNNEIGLPLSVLEITDEDEIAVIEMGISDFGEMHRLSEVARPDVCVMTNIGQCHLENLGDRDGVLRAKSEIFDFINPHGAIIINGDDDKLATLKEVKGIVPVTFGMSEKCDIRADMTENLGLSGSRARIHISPKLLKADAEVSFDVQVPLPGEHMISNAMAAAAAGLYFGLDVSEIVSGISKTGALPGRSNIIRSGDKIIIDDCYNANPVSVKAALDLLNTSDTRTVAVLGDMFELGDDASALHEDVGRYAAGCGTDLIICIGELSEKTADAAREAGGRAVYFRTKEDFYGRAGEMLKRGDTILVKASHAMGFEEIVSYISSLNN